MRLHVNRSVTLLENQFASRCVRLRANRAPKHLGTRVLDHPQVVRCRLLPVDPSVLPAVPCRHPRDVHSVHRVALCRHRRVVLVRRGRALEAPGTADRVRARLDLQEVSEDPARGDRALAEHLVVLDLVADRELPEAVVLVDPVEEAVPVEDLVRVVDGVRREVVDVAVGAERTTSSRR